MACCWSSFRTAFGLVVLFAVGPSANAASTLDSPAVAAAALDVGRVEAALPAAADDDDDDDAPCFFPFRGLPPPTVGVVTADTGRLPRAPLAVGAADPGVIIAFDEESTSLADDNVFASPPLPRRLPAALRGVMTCFLALPAAAAPPRPVMTFFFLSFALSVDRSIDGNQPTKQPTDSRPHRQWQQQQQQAAPAINKQHTYIAITGARKQTHHRLNSMNAHDI